MTKEELGMKVVEKIYKVLVGGTAYEVIEKGVRIFENEEMSNDEKRKAVKDMAIPYVKSFGKFILASVITFAVDSMRLYMEKKALENGVPK